MYRILLFIIIVSSLSLMMCGPAPKEYKSDPYTANDNNSLKGNPPHVLLAIIQESENPPSQAMITRFENLLNEIGTVYPDLNDKEIADKLSLSWDLARKEGCRETLLQFTTNLIGRIQSLIEDNSIIEFEMLLAIHVVTCGA